MKDLFCTVIALAFVVALAFAAYAVGGWWTMGAFFGVMAVASSGLILWINAREVDRETPPLRNILNVAPEPELDLTRMLQNRPSGVAQDQLSETGRTILRRVVTQTNGHTPHPERKDL